MGEIVTPKDIDAKYAKILETVRAFYATNYDNPKNVILFGGISAADLANACLHGAIAIDVVTGTYEEKRKKINQPMLI